MSHSERALPEYAAAFIRSDWGRMSACAFIYFALMCCTVYCIVHLYVRIASCARVRD